MSLKDDVLRTEEIEAAAVALFEAQEAVEEIKKQNPTSRAERLQHLKDEALALAEMNDAEKILNKLIKGEN